MPSMRVLPLGGPGKGTWWVDAYACVIGGTVYQNEVQYRDPLKETRSAAGYMGLKKIAKLNKQDLVAKHGHLYLHLWKVESNGIVRYSCMTRAGGECKSTVRRELMYKTL